MASSTQAYTGLWVDWSKGRILGATLTLSERKGALLTNALALFVQLAGSHFWGVMKYAIHQMRASEKPHDALFYQQQAILRNRSSAETVLGLLSISRVWRSPEIRPFRRCLLLLLIAGLHMCGFILAAIFSANVAMENAGALLRSPTCGLWSISQNTTEATDVAENGHWTEYIDYMTNYEANTIMSASDVRACTMFDAVNLNNSVTLANQCDVSTGPINWQDVTYDAPCPFAPGMCLDKASNGAFQLDSGPINSDSGFGINAPPHDQITLRRVITCAPITTDGFTSDYIHNPWNAPEEGIKYYYYGPSHYTDSTSDYTSWISNFTTSSYRNVTPTSESYTIGYALGIQAAPWDFSPIKQLSVSDGDVTLLFLSSIAAYWEPVDDPWFSAHVKLETENEGTMYFADEPVGVLGCLEQVQICNPNNPSTSASACTPLTGAVNIMDDLRQLGLSPRQNATVQRLYTTMQANTINQVVSTLGPDYMVAARSLTVSLSAWFSLPLPNNQWMLEVMNLADIMITNTQRMIVEFATGPLNPQFITYFETPTERDWQQMCLNQRVPALPHYTSINVLGAAIILTVGSLIIIIDFRLGSVVYSIEKRLKKEESLYKHGRWILDGTLQLQRQSCQDRGLGTWERCNKETPIAPPGVMFSLPADFGNSSSPNSMETEEEEKEEEEEEEEEGDTNINPRDGGMPPQIPEIKNLMDSVETNTNAMESGTSPGQNLERSNFMEPEEANPDMMERGRSMLHLDNLMESEGANTDSMDSRMPTQLRRWTRGRGDGYVTLENQGS